MEKIIKAMKWNGESGAINFRPFRFDLWANPDDIPIWRSGSLVDINLQQVNIIHDILGIEYWFGFHASPELGQNWLHDMNLKKVNFILHEDKLFRKLHIPQEEDYFNLYWHYLTNCRHVIKECFNYIAAFDTPHRLLISCYAGKDRTGLICILLAGVFTNNYKLIINDYCCSTQYLIDQINFFKSNWERRQLSASSYIKRFYTLERTVTSLLSKINVKYSGIISYLNSIGITDVTINKIKMHYEPYLKSQHGF